MKSLIRSLSYVMNSKNTFGIEEFQHTIEEILLPDVCKMSLEKFQHNACNRLEEIKYCYAESQKNMPMN